MKYFVLLTYTLTLAVASAHGPGRANDFEGRRVLFIGMDGCRADAMVQAMERGFAPQLKSLAADGVFTQQIYAGGEKGLPTEQPTVSGPGWATLLTGVWQNKHHVISNAFKNNSLAHFPHFMRYLKEMKPASWSASFTSWPAVNDRIVGDSRDGTTGLAFVDALFTATYDSTHGTETTPDKDIEVRNAAIDALKHQDPDVMFLHFGQLDEYGHGTVDSRASFSPDSALYIHSIGVVDSHIGEVLRALRQRPHATDEKWLILVTTDHGGKGNGHGGQSDAERNIWMIAQAEGLPKDDLLSKAFGQTYVPRLIFRHLGLAVNPDWNWEPDPFMTTDSIRNAP